MEKIATAYSKIEAEKSVAGTDLIKHKNYQSKDFNSEEELISYEGNILIKFNYGFEFYDNSQNFVDDYGFCREWEIYVEEDEFNGDKELFEMLKEEFSDFKIINEMFCVTIAENYSDIYYDELTPSCNEVFLSNKFLEKCIKNDMKIYLVTDGQDY